MWGQGLGGSRWGGRLRLGWTGSRPGLSCRGACGLWGRPGVGTHLPELGHGLAGNDLIVVQPGNEAESLELTLPLLQLSQNQGPEDLHILMGKGRRMGAGWRGWGLLTSPPTPPSAQLSPPPPEDTGLDTVLQRTPPSCCPGNFFFSHLNP